MTTGTSDALRQIAGELSDVFAGKGALTDSGAAVLLRRSRSPNRQPRPTHRQAHLASQDDRFGALAGWYRIMPDLRNCLAEFERQVGTSEGVVANVEALWQTAPRGSEVRKQIGGAQMGALYEMAYLSMFGHWENFVESCLTRMLAGQGCPSYSPALVAPPMSTTLGAARLRLLGGNRYLLWHDPKRCVSRISSHVTGSPLEASILASQSSLESYAAIRHAIAHRSQDSLDQFRAASILLCGISEKAPGDFLRRQDHTDPLNPVRWIRRISSDLRTIATNCCN